MDKPSPNRLVTVFKVTATFQVVYNMWITLWVNGGERYDFKKNVGVIVVPELLRGMVFYTRFSRAHADKVCLASCAINPTFQNNTFENVGRTIQFIAWKNEGPVSQYPITYNQLSETNKQVLKTNKAINTAESIIRINHTYNEYVQNTEKVPLE